MMKVESINGTKLNPCSCGSWLEHWKSFSGQKLPTCCSEVKCAQKPEFGSLVLKAGSSDNTWYVVPLCTKHDAEVGGAITILDHVALVSTEVGETCGKERKKQWWE